MYSKHKLDWILQKTFNMDRKVVLQFLSNVTKKISDKDSSVAPHLTTECFNRVTAYQQSENFQDSVNRFKMRIQPKDVLLFWHDEKMSNEKSIRLVILTYPNLTMVQSSRLIKDFVPVMMEKMEQKNGMKNYRRRYELRREKEKVKEKQSTLNEGTSFYLQTNDILVWNFDFLKPDLDRKSENIFQVTTGVIKTKVKRFLLIIPKWAPFNFHCLIEPDDQILNMEKLKVQTIAVVKLENCLHHKEHTEWKHYLNICSESLIRFCKIVSYETTSFYRKPLSHMRYFLTLKTGKKALRLYVELMRDMKEMQK